MRKLVIVAGVCGLLVAGSAQAAQRGEGDPPPQVRRLMQCRAVAAAAERLACFDREIAVIDQALASRSLVVVDRERAREAKRSLFGFSIPNFGGLFGGDDEDISEIEGTIAKTAHNVDGGWVIYLADGSIWSQTDDWPGLDARPGRKVIVKRGALGSFRLFIPGENGIKVKRIG